MRMDGFSPDVNVSVGARSGQWQLRRSAPSGQSWRRALLQQRCPELAAAIAKLDPKAVTDFALKSRK
jgi:hypothetical protein